MARIRSIKPDFWTDEKIVDLTFPARLLFIGLWNFADDEGRMEYSPRRLKMQIFPNDDLDATILITELEKHGLVIVYANGQKVLQIVNFSKHQKIDKRSESRLPPPIHPESRRVAPTEGNGREGKGSGREKQKPRAADAPPDPRKATLRDALKKGWQWKNPDKGECPWGAPEEVAINALLADVGKEMPGDALVQCVRNKFLSDESHSGKPRSYIRLLLTYMESPLDRFGKPKSLGAANDTGNRAEQRQRENVSAIRKAGDRLREQIRGTHADGAGSQKKLDTLGSGFSRTDDAVAEASPGVRAEGVRAGPRDSSVDVEVFPGRGGDPNGDHRRSDVPGVQTVPADENGSGLQAVQRLGVGTGADKHGSGSKALPVQNKPLT